MGEIDTMTKQYMKDNERFADLINWFVFDGRHALDASELEEMDITSIAVAYLEKNFDAVQKARDVLKKCVAKDAGNAFFVIFGIENQADIHNAMVVRNMLYDAICYENQVSKISNYNRKEKLVKNGEYLAGFRKDDKLIPVVTLTLYWGTKKWDGPKTLHEMFVDIPQDIKKLIPNYWINLISPAEMDCKDINKLQTELNQLFRAIRAGAEGPKALAGLAEDESFSKLSIDSALLMGKIVNLDVKVPDEGGTVNMCEAMKELKQMCYEDGRAEGRIETLMDFVKDLMRDEGKTFDEACAKVKATPKEAAIIKDIIFK